MADPRIKIIKIKSNVVKRIIKEKSTYEKEVLQTEEKINKMKNEGKDEYDIKKMVRRCYFYKYHHLNEFT